MSETVLKLDNVIKLFGKCRAVNGISFEVKEGEKLLIYGPLGGGKTTLFRLICGLEQPDGGEISCGSMSMVAEEDGLIPELTILENVALYLEMRGKKCRKEAKELLKRLGIEHIAGVKAARVGRFERRLAALAAAVMASPKLLILDEYTSGFSEREERLLLERLHELTGDTTILMFSSKRYDEGFDRCLYMEHGEIKEEVR